MICCRELQYNIENRKERFIPKDILYLYSPHTPSSRRKWLRQLAPNVKSQPHTGTATATCSLNPDFSGAEVDLVGTTNKTRGNPTCARWSRPDHRCRGAALRSRRPSRTPPANRASSRSTTRQTRCKRSLQSPRGVPGESNARRAGGIRYPQPQARHLIAQGGPGEVEEEARKSPTPASSPTPPLGEPRQAKLSRQISGIFPVAGGRRRRR